VQQVAVAVELKRQLKTFPAILSRAPLTRESEREREREREKKREEINFPFPRRDVSGRKSSHVARILNLATLIVAAADDRRSTDHGPRINLPADGRQVNACNQ